MNKLLDLNNSITFSTYFTIINIIECSINNFEIVKNPAVWNKHGAGPIAISMLTDMYMSVTARELEIGMSALLDQSDVNTYKLKSGIPVGEFVLKELKVCSND